MHSNVTDMYLNMRILKFEDIFRLELGKTMHALNNHLLSSPLSILFNYIRNRHATTTRGSLCGNFSLPKIKKEYTDAYYHILELFVGTRLKWNNVTLIKVNLKLSIKDHF